MREANAMVNNRSTLKVTLEINQETNLDELLAHLYLMQDTLPSQYARVDDLLVDFTIHEGALEPPGHLPAI